MYYPAIGATQGRRARVLWYVERTMTRTSQACHQLTAFASLAVLLDALLFVLVPVVTVRPQEKALSGPTLHANSMCRTAESSLYLYRLHDAPHTGNPLSSPWLALLATTRFSLSMISQMGSCTSHITRERRYIYVYTLFREYTGQLIAIMYRPSLVAILLGFASATQ
ncbi:hypothetical protein M422DRAFT_270367 [Sphaerobolus stellatus SS14]|uniref:Uncharacterized protein n=1 Tax=Sphaerobolus stellatus (strain SS14) TaxID=990650 RepID=A0A0C9U2L1_SPHS4|nr:hypothetical protein M422DRAFT_270367 [Sphaerobolus stellatus SS14]